MDVFHWLEEELKPSTCTSAEFIYDDVDSQSGRSLPLIYKPFDAGLKSHWRDRGAMWDYLFATKGEGQRLLDFGPGDGWPSLIVAPLAGQIVGVDGARKRVAVCTANAERLGLSNASFTYVAPGTPLPYPNDAFDGAMAASSVEQSPDPEATLREIHRVLRPGGRLRIDYESLGGYRNGGERALWLVALDDHRCRLVLFNRDIEGECVRQYGITYAMSRQDLVATLSAGADALSFVAVTVPRLQAMSSQVIDARVCTTVHPSGPTLARWLREIGFREVYPTHSGSWFAGELFDALHREDRPGSIEAVDARLRPIVQVIVDLPAPIETDPMITAVK
jgi:SAM-dependent methyltransferase